MSLYICPNPQNVQYQETLKHIIDFGWFYVSYRFLIGKKVSFWWVMLIIEEAIHVWGRVYQYMENLCTFLSILLQT